jgi:acyl-CoA thioester hydrolase
VSPATTYETRIPTRWPDFDAVGHLNHAALLVYLDEARDEVLTQTVGDFDAWPNVVVHLDLDFRVEIPLRPRDVVVRTSVAEVGRSSIKLEQTLLAPSGAAAVECRAVLVAWDAEARRAREISESERRSLLGGAA